MATRATHGEVLELVRTGAAATRSDVRRLTGLSRTAVDARVDALLEARLLVPAGPTDSTGGRPAAGLSFHRSAGVVLAAAVGRSRSQVAVFDLSGEELASASLDHQIGAGPDSVMPTVAESLRQLVATTGGRVLGVSLSLPGTVDQPRGLSIDSAVMRGWDGVPLRPYLHELGDVPIYVGNDADVLARSEALDRSRPYDEVIVVKASTGLGLGLVSRGQVLQGHFGAAGEIGHTKVEAAGDLPCRCGARGCLETIAGGWALVADRDDPDVAHVRDLTRLALEGEAAARQALRESGRLLGEVLAVAINLLNPRAVILGGDMAAAFDVYAAGVRESVYARATALATRELQILPAAYGDRAGLVGCAALALDHLLSPAGVDQLLSRA